ncbi:type IV pilus modification PilV family protein [Brevibacillus sp. SYSU BS000544]|uniref:type IV pilus modification PilV family protein n=1 Tax=Brevibacillus sp. SYSU BS000544 TaxID=3416443 RepID=UPI003CE49C37
MNYIQNEKGLTLVEIVASLVILSLALLMMSNFLVRSFEISGDQDNRLVAMNIARQVAEQWKSGNGSYPADSKFVTRDFSSDSDITNMANKELEYEHLETLARKILASSNPDYSIPLSEITVNERNYNPFINLTLFPEDPADPTEINPLGHNPIVIVTVHINDTQGATLATLQAGVADPAKGGP